MTKITTYCSVVAAAPVLGKGLNPGSKIDLFVDTPPVRTRHKPSSSDAAKVSVLHMQYGTWCHGRTALHPSLPSSFHFVCV